MLKWGNTHLKRRQQQFRWWILDVIVGRKDKWQTPMPYFSILEVKIFTKKMIYFKFGLLRIQFCL
jgi:hypothetical protein